MGGDRRSQRTKKRLACTPVIGGHRTAGIVLDLSATGLFVQASANPPPGAKLDLEIDIPGESQRPLLAVRVARMKVVPPRLKSVVHGGVGLQIDSAPEAFFRYLTKLQPGEVAAAPPAKPLPARKSGARRSPSLRLRAVAKEEWFRVRASQAGSSRSRSLKVRAVSEEDARREAMAALGQGWEIHDTAAARAGPHVPGQAKQDRLRPVEANRSE